jgi:PhzF family phenazine biosynthesis protein
MTLPIYQVDAFADRLFSGNPAAVVVTGTELSAQTMQAVAAENNLAETAFVVADGGSHAIRWFTPTVEVELCGHATLAAAHLFFEHLGHPGKSITFSSRSGALHVRKHEGLLWLDFPADTVETIEADALLAEALGVRPLEHYEGRDDLMAVLESEEQVASLSPNMALLAKLPVRGVIVTAKGSKTDFVSRFFAPRSGIPEDPVTGSAHTTLTPYWSDKLGKQQLTARQISPRGGELVCKNLGERIEIGGQAVTYLAGEIFV